LQIFRRVIPCQKMKSYIWDYQMVNISRPCFRSTSHNTGCDTRTNGQTETCCCRKDRAMHIVARVKCLTSSEKLVLSKIRFVLSLKKCSRFVVVLVRDRPCLTHCNSRCSIKDGCNIKTFREYTVPESNYIGVTLLVLYLIKRVRQYLP